MKTALALVFAALTLTPAPIARAAAGGTDWSAAEAAAARVRDQALKGSLAYPLLSSLTTEIGPRLEGSDNEHRAAQWGVETLKRLGFQNVHIESFPVNGWTRGEEQAAIVSPAPQRLMITALGNSPATPPEGIEAEVAVFHTYAELLAAPAGSLKGKIAVVTQPMERSRDGSGYGKMYMVRGLGALEAERRGAIGYMLRSLATGTDRRPHTGASTPAHIPAAALAAPDAEQLDRLAALGKPVHIRLVLTPRVRPSATADTVIGEIPGRERGDEIVLIGGHLDSWDLGTGAIDDGAGVAITIAAAKLVAEQGPPRRTIRVALFGAEELNFSNAAYARAHPAAEQARHVIASESDFGAEPVYAVRLPEGAAQAPFGRALAAALKPLDAVIEPQAAHDGGSDLESLVGVPLAALRQDGTHYFDYHHTPDDTLDKVDPARLDKTVAAWAAFTWLAANTDVDFRAAPKPTAPPARP